MTDRNDTEQLPNDPRHDLDNDDVDTQQQPQPQQEEEGEREPNPANAEAARADAARYAAADQSGALIATHGDAGAQIVTEFDPAAASGDPRFVNRVVIVNPANAEAAKADAARYPKPVFHTSDSEDEAAKIRG